MGFSPGLVKLGNGGELTAERAVIRHSCKDAAKPHYNVSMAWAPIPSRNGARQRALILSTNAQKEEVFSEFVCACIEHVGGDAGNRVKIVGIMNCIDVDLYGADVLNRILKYFTSTATGDASCSLECFVAYPDDYESMAQLARDWKLKCNGIPLAQQLYILGRRRPFTGRGSHGVSYLNDQGAPSASIDGEFCTSHKKRVSEKDPKRRHANSCCSLRNVTELVDLINR